MPFALSVLASGSAGNGSVLRLRTESGAARTVLVDGGLAPRTLRARLAARRVDLDEVREVVLTHADHDHLHPGFAAWASANGRRVHLHRRHRAVARRRGLDPARMCLFDGDSIELDAGVTVEPVPLAHDDLGTSGFVFEHAGRRLGYATDLGHVPECLHERFRDLDGLAIESNYDPALQRASPRPAFLKRRIMGGLGHLSNEQALEAVLRIGRRSRLGRIILLHLSRQCNNPALVRTLWSRRAPELHACLVITSQRCATDWVAVAPGAQQLSLWAVE